MNYDSLNRAAFVLDEAAFRQNLEHIAEVAQRADVDIILALKAFSFWPTFHIVKEYLSGATASSLHEAKLVSKHMGVKPHVYGPAYIPSEFDEVVELAHHLTFNSLSELERYRTKWEGANLSVGLRVNPMYSDVETALYNPASPTGRLGVPIDDLPAVLPKGQEGIHVHSLCESPAASTAKLIEKVEKDLCHWLPKLKWLNLGGGHLLTKEGYETEVLVEALKGFRARHPHISVTLEPGSAHAWQTGVLVAHVLDIVKSHGRKTAMLDVSFTCHMPDTLEMPYQPTLQGAKTVSAETEGDKIYHLGGVSCLAGDTVGAYQFEAPLVVGQQLILEDMLHYTTVKTTTFNGVQLPDLAIERLDGTIEIVRSFTFSDYEGRLG
ncbi:MAG: carboxynorspermidine decarboxylase [Saprospiraceae bacterium]